MLRNFMVSSPCFEFGVALRTGHDLLKSVKRRTWKARSLQVRRTTLFEIDRANNLFSERDAELLLHPDARSRKLSGLAGTRVLEPPVGSLCRLPIRNSTR